MRINVTAIPAIHGTWQQDMRSTRQCVDDNKWQPLLTAIGIVVVEACENAAAYGHDMRHRLNSVIVQFEQFE